MYSLNQKAKWPKIVALLEYLVIEYEYVYLEGTWLSENGAFRIHPTDWPKSDTDNAKRCWPAMERAGLEFVGVNGPVAPKGTEIKHFDGLLFNKPCELKYLHPEGKIDQEKLIKKIKDKMSDANSQKAEIAVIVLHLSEYASFNW